MNFKISIFLKNATFFKKHKKSTISKISIVWCFSSRADQFVNTDINVNFIKKILSKPFFL